MIDLHCHVLPGIDDGPATIEQSIALARAAAAEGIRTIVATSHVSFAYRNHADTIATLVDRVNLGIARAGIDVTVVRGAEVAMTYLPNLGPLELARLSLGDSRWLLLEPPFTSIVIGLDRVVADLARSGYQTVLAHPERCQAFQHDRESLERLVASGVLVSVTASSLAGRFGPRVKRFAHELLAAELVHNVASDAHGIAGRTPSMRADLIGLPPALSEWLTEAVPRAILDGSDIPTRPTVAPGRARRAWWPSLSRG